MRLFNRHCSDGVLCSPPGVSRTAVVRVVRLSAILLVCMASPTGLTGQTRADRESVAEVVRLLFLSAGDFADEVARHPGIWSVVIAKFAKGESREIEIPAKAGEWYQAEGGSDSDGTDVDICIYGPDGSQIDCDTEEENFPIVGFLAETDGVYRAVLTAATVEGGGTSFAGMVVLRVLIEEEDGRGGRR